MTYIKDFRCAGFENGALIPSSKPTADIRVKRRGRDRAHVVRSTALKSIYKGSRK